MIRLRLNCFCTPLHSSGFGKKRNAISIVKAIKITITAASLTADEARRSGKPIYMLRIK